MTKVLFDKDSIRWVLKSLKFEIDGDCVIQNNQRIKIDDIIYIDKKHGIVTNVFDLM